MRRDRCPRCDGTNTERVHTEWHRDMVEEIRICRHCGAQYINDYELFEQETDVVYDE